MRISETRLRQIIREELQTELSMSDVGHVLLDIAGIIPGIGEVADAENALLFAREGNFLFAVLSLISVIPEVGDAVGKGGKLATWVTEKLPRVASAVSKYGPDVIKYVKVVKDLIVKNRTLIEKLFKAAEKNENIKKYVPQMKQALNTFASQNKEDKQVAKTMG